MFKAKITHNNTQFSLCGMILHKLVYPLATTTFTPEQCSKILHPVLQDGLPKAGLVCTMLHALVHSSPLCGL